MSMSNVPNTQIVTPELDPGVHLFLKMDCRVESGNDEWGDRA